MYYSQIFEIFQSLFACSFLFFLSLFEAMEFQQNKIGNSSTAKKKKYLKAMLPFLTLEARGYYNQKLR